MPNTLKKKKRPLKPAVILTACLLGLLSIFAFLLFSSYSPFIISGSSMEPDYPAYSLVIINKSGFDTLKVGDTVVFKSAALGNNLAFHRVIRISDSGVYTKGDNNNREDNQLITKESYVGKEALKITFLARYISILKSVTGFIVFFLMPLSAAFFIFISFKMLKGLRRA